GKLVPRHLAEDHVGVAKALLLGDRSKVDAGQDLLAGGIGGGLVGEKNLRKVPLLGSAELVLARLVGGSHIAIVDLNLVLDRLRSDRQHADLAVFGLRELVAVIVVIALEVLVGRIGDPSRRALRNQHIAELARLAIIVVESSDQHARTISHLADGREDLAAQIALAQRVDIALLAHADGLHRLLEYGGTKITGGVLEGGILHDLVENLRIANVKIERPGMGIDGRPADQPLHHSAIEPEPAGFLQAQTPAGLRAHGAEHILLGTHIFVRADLGIAHGYQVLTAEALEPAGREPNDEARNQQEDEDDANDAAS